MMIYLTTATNAHFYQSLGVTANSEPEARTAFEAFLASDENQHVEQTEHDYAARLYDDADRADSTYALRGSINAFPKSEADYSEDMHLVLSKPVGTVLMLDSGGNG